jgi:hypothetical protein
MAADYSNVSNEIVQQISVIISENRGQPPSTDEWTVYFVLSVPTSQRVS